MPRFLCLRIGPLQLRSRLRVRFCPRFRSRLHVRFRADSHWARPHVRLRPAPLHKRFPRRILDPKNHCVAYSVYLLIRLHNSIDLLDHSPYIHPDCCHAKISSLSIRVKVSKP